MNKATILIADDERLIRWSLVQRLSAEGYGTIEAESGRQTLARFDDAVDLVLLDYRLGDTDGLQVLEALRRQDPDVLVIVLTAYSNIETAVAVMKQGAYHYVTKPFNLDEIALLVAKALETTRLRRELRAIRASQREPYSLDRIIGDSPAVADVKKLLGKIASSPASTVLLTGESGTGKDLAAKVIHYTSARATRPFMNITCSAPLRNRAEDVPVLVRFFVDGFNREFRKHVQDVAPDAIDALQRHAWPGNVRELRNAIERAVLLSEGNRLTATDFPMLRPRDELPTGVTLPPAGTNLEAIERDLVVQALERTGWNQTRAAALLGLNRDQIRYRIEKFTLSR